MSFFDERVRRTREAEAELIELRARYERAQQEAEEVRQELQRRAVELVYEGRNRYKGLFFTVTTVAELCGVSRKTVHQWVQAGRPQ